MITSVNELEKIIRSYLISQSELDAKYVRNSLSLYGEDLNKLLEQQIYASIHQSDSLILFELQSRENESDMSETEKDETISYYRSYRLYVIIYGDSSTDIANKLATRFRTEHIRTSLQSSDVYLESISNPTKINEFKNETMWLRNDLEIDISCKLSITQVNIEQPFTDKNDMIIEGGS